MSVLLPRQVSKLPLPIKGGKWLQLKQITYTDQLGRTRFWETVERTPRGETAPPTAATDNPSSAASIPRQEPECDAAAIFPILKGKTTMDHQTIIITQYRPPVDAFVVEMPAGLIDANESAESTAVRELLEETGYVGTVKETSMVLFNSPGMSGECMKLVIMDVDLDLDVNKNVVPRLEDGEFIETHIVPIKSLYTTLLDFKSKGFAVDARLHHFAHGLHLASTFSV